MGSSPCPPRPGTGDTLTGGLGLDLFFVFPQDKVTDRQAPTEVSL